jgi:hypothetical protein
MITINLNPGHGFYAYNSNYENRNDHGMYWGSYGWKTSCSQNYWKDKDELIASLKQAGITDFLDETCNQMVVTIKRCHYGYFASRPNKTECLYWGNNRWNHTCGDNNGYHPVKERLIESLATQGWTNLRDESATLLTN